MLVTSKVVLQQEHQMEEIIEWAFLAIEIRHNMSKLLFLYYDDRDKGS